MNCKNILIVEDDPAVRQTMQDILEIHGYSVFTASNGQEGLYALEDIAPEPCVILLDLMMPVMSGWGFLDLLRSKSETRDIPVVICSAYEATAKAINPSAFVPKPLQLDTLLDAVKAFCA